VHIDPQFFHREQSHEVERALLTAGTAMFHRLLSLRREQLREGEVVSAGAQVLAANPEGLSVVAVGEESGVADFDETEGEDVEKETADKFHGLQAHDLEAFAVLGVPPPEVDTIFCEAHQSAVRDGHAVGITSQILEHVLGAGMRRKELIRRAGRKITVEAAHVNRAAGRIVNRINVRLRARGVSQANNLLYVVDGPNSIRSIAHRHKPSARGDLLLEVRHI
jgi:hypothetical protein